MIAKYRTFKNRQIYDSEVNPYQRPYCGDERHRPYKSYSQCNAYIILLRVIDNGLSYSTTTFTCNK